MVLADLYALPHEVTDLELAYGACLGDLLPPLEIIPASYPNQQEWLLFQHKLFTGTLPGGCIVDTADGIDPVKAGRHIMAIQRSFEPKHVHKMAAVAWLASRWFTRVWDPDGSYACPKEMSA